MAIQKIQGQQPFQVLATNFSIGPSNEGYTLQISANGKDYSDLFSVGANVTRMVTGVANGSYYRLSGNNSEVSINWRTQCNDGGSGGGSGSGSTVSVNQILTAGTEIAQISVDGQNTSLYAPEGGEGGDSLVHLETLSGATGETNVVYECDGELYWWNESGGTIGKWNVLPTTGTSMTNYRNWFTFKYTSVSAATQLISFQVHTGSNEPAYVLINPDRTLTGVNYAGQTKTIAVGETDNISYRSGYYWTVVNNGNSISMAPIADNLTFQSKIVSIWDGNTNQPHWEMVNKTITPYVSGGTSTTTIGVPRVSSDGQILSYDQTNKAGLKVNGTNKGSIYTTQQTQTLNWYIPTTSGISGQILQSNGNAAPTWVDMPGGGDYQVVSGLPASAEEGQMFYVPAHTITYSGITLDRNGVDENYIGNINGVTDTPAVYYSNGAFYWGWENDGYPHYDSRGFYYQSNGSNGTFVVAPMIDGVSVTPLNGATTAATPNAVSVDVSGTTYIYKDGGFQTVEYSKKQYFIDDMASAERAALWAEIVTLTNSGQTNLTQVLSNYEFFIKAQWDGQVWGQAYFIGFEASAVWIGGTRPTKSSYPCQILRNLIGIYANGEITTIQDEPKIPSNVGYFDNYSNYLVLNEVSGFTTDAEGNEIGTDITSFGSNFYWRALHPLQTSLSDAIPALPFKKINAEGEVTMHYYPSIVVKTLNEPYTEGDIDYTEEVRIVYRGGFYGDFYVGFYINSSFQFTGFDIQDV